MTDSTFNQICYIARYPDLRINNPTFYRYKNYWYTSLQPKLGFAPKEQFKFSDNPLKHFQEIGMAEGRMGGCDLPGTIYSELFNSKPYILRYPDLKGTWAENNPLLHYQEYGLKEGRVPGYEIINENTVQGLVTPGTTIFQDEKKESNVPGDNTVIKNPVPITENNNIFDTIKKNGILISAIAAIALLVIFKNKKR